MASPYTLKSRTLLPSQAVRRNRVRQALLEALERREMLASDAAGVVFAPGTSQAYMDEWINRFNPSSQQNADGSPARDEANLQGSRWTNPVGGPSPNMGDPARVTWSIVPDGTIDSSNNAPSNLIAFMDGIYGGGTGPVSQRPWFNIFQRAYDRWTEVSGLTFVYEANDDGLAMGGSARGVAGVRGDVRIGGRNIDGNFGVLAFNYYPNNGGNSGFDGDMIIDTGDRWYRDNADGPTGENRGLFNVLMHEAGHGIGLAHTIPINGTKLMEPTASLGFVGAQHDDILGSQQLYGDPRERNNSAATATDLGDLDNGLTRINNVSVHSNPDADWYTFKVPSAGKISVNLLPVGQQYLVGPQGGTAVNVDTQRNSDLAFQLSMSDGTVLANVNASGLGLAESLTDLQLPSGGQYFLRISGTSANTTPQLYDLAINMKGLISGNADIRAPRLLSVAPNSGEIFSVNRVNVLNEAPTELVFRFDGAQLLDASSLSAIRLTRSGRDGSFNSGNEQVIVPGWVGFGDTDRVIIMRFSSPLVDDSYRIEIMGVDLPAAGLTAVRNIDQLPLNPRLAGTDRDTLYFRLELGAQVVAVVPQPVDRGVPAPGQQAPLVQRLSDIDVYFNNDDLDPLTAEDPAFYQLILTNDSVNPKDDIVFLPTSVAYDPVLDKATLTFAQPLHELIGGAGTLRLRVGSRVPVSSSALLPNVVQINPADPGGSFNSAYDLTGSLGSLTQAVSGRISEQLITTSTSPHRLTLDFPGSNFDPGHRDIQDEIHIGNTRRDSDQSIAKTYYNFSLGRPYGFDSGGNPVYTSITPEQIDRVREIFEFFSMQMGIDFAESEAAGLTVVVGDMWPLGVESGIGGVLGVAGSGLAIMDGADVWDNSFGASFFDVAMHEIGHLLGLVHSYDLPVGTMMGNDGNLTSGSPLEWLFPGDHDTLHGRHLYRPDNRDTDMYRFEVPAGQRGRLTLEVIAERLRDSSDVDTYLTLMRRTATGYEIVATNNDYFSSDSYIDIEIGPGEYFVAITAKGNENSNPLVDNTGGGGVSQGRYELLFDFRPSGVDTIVDTSGTPLDGNGDGRPGGDFNFWFRVAPPVELAAPGEPKTVYVDKGWVGPAGGTLGSLARPYTNLPAAAAALQPGDVLRVLGSVGADNNLATVADNPAYEIGRGGVGNQILSDGLTFEVPQGVTMVIDAGAVFKLRGSRLVAGSRDAGIDHRFSSIQVLGTPLHSVIFTSYNDESVGVDTNPIVTNPTPGDWGGIEIHNDVDRLQGRGDYERQGIFLNYIAHADIRFGGGQVTVANPSPTISPIHLAEARPTLLHNRITRSADSAISADPNSFEETLFTEPRYQLAGAFSPDYSRVGPDIRGNTILNNSINGLFIRISTQAGQPLDTLDVPARLQSTNLTYVLGENLIVTGRPGGAFVETTAPDMSLAELVPTASGSLVPGQTHNYKLVFVDLFGGEGIPSAATPLVTVGVNGGIELRNLPAASGEFVSRQLWRSAPGGAGPYTLVAELDRETSTAFDRGQSLNATRASLSEGSLQRARPDARLAIDPGVVMKVQGARIEAGIGAQIIAEGTAARPIVFTTRADDRFGGGGTFDTNNDQSGSLPVAGSWGGIVARHLSSLSIDHALITYGGGVVSVPGGFGGFNAVEVHQAEARIAHSVFEHNASGKGGNLSALRGDVGPNDAATIYVSSAQPVLINNVLRNNLQSAAAAISIDANSLKAIPLQDGGRQTGANLAMPGALGNMGPLVRGNRLANNGLNGMRVRGAVLTTEAVWDDTDIVHVLQSEIIIPDFHSLGGLRLQSKLGESLVVKLGSGAGFTATGRPLDMPNRIGGSLQIIGSPGFPVVLTSLTDDTVGAGFDPSGRPQVDTDGMGQTTGTRGSWRSVRFDAYSNDRNLDTTYELEPDQIQDRGVNDEPATAQALGALAAVPDQGDENLRLGFTIHGSIASPSDLDVYSFTASAGTLVWFDIDQTGAALDSVLELIDSAGRIIALSDNSLAESTAASPAVFYRNPALINPNHVQPLDLDPKLPRNTFAPAAARDFYSTNPLDAGMRIVLPGAVGTQNTYFVRVRSSNVGPGQAQARLLDPALVTAGLTTGAYRLQVRLQQLDEVAGSTVRYADIRFATNGVEVLGMPGHSPLLGETSEINPDSGNIINPTNLGNIANSDRAAVSVAGALGTPGDVDWYSFSIYRDSIQQPGGPHVGVTLDIDYADGLGRPNTSLWLYRVVGSSLQLVMMGTDSNITDDRPAPGQGTDWDDLLRGSLGSRDAFIGTQELPPGNYMVAVTNNSLIAQQLRQFQQANPGSLQNALVRIEPINSVQRISVDRFESANFPETAVAPQQVAFSGNANAVPWTLADVTTFTVVDEGSGSRVLFTNAMTGAREADVSTAGRVYDAAMSPDGRLVAYLGGLFGSQTDANTSQFVILDSTGVSGVQNAGSSGLQTFTTEFDGTNWVIRQRNGTGDGMVFNALSFYHQTVTSGLQLWGVASRGNGNSYRTPIRDANNAIINASAPVDSAFVTNVLYRLDPTSGSVINPQGLDDRTGDARVTGAGTNRREFGHLTSSNTVPNPGTVTGIARDGGRLIAVSDTGAYWIISVGAGTNFIGNVPATGVLTDDQGNPISFQGLTTGPRNVEAGTLANTFFGMTTNGTTWAFRLQGNTAVLAPVFPGAEASVRTTTAPGSFSAVRGLDFSPLDVNLWHVTDTLGNAPGHGRPATFDGSRPANQPGENSLYFGFEDPSRGGGRQPGIWNGVYDVAAYRNTFNLPGGAHGAMESNPIDLRGYGIDDQPMLYFTYYLSTENANSNNQDSAMMRDAFRVYGAGDDGNWILLATNNSARSSNYADNMDEFDLGISGFQDANGRAYMPQELYDINDGGAPDAWRQARIPLAPFAGLNNVRLRFEFSSGASFRTGDPLRGGLELTAVEGWRIRDGQGFTVSTVASATPRTANFEFDLGLVLNLPGAASLVSGSSSLTINGTPYTFVLGDGSGDNISYAATDSPQQIATRVINKLGGTFTITRNSVRSNVLNFATSANLPDVGTYSTTSMPAGTIEGLPGVAAGRVSIPVNQSMSIAAIQSAVRAALARGLNATGQESNISVWPVSGNNIKIYKHAVTANTSPLGLNSTRAGDLFGVDTRGGFGFDRMAERAQNNTGRGVFVDDIVIGLAERGEMIHGAETTTFQTGTPGGFFFAPDAHYEPVGWGINEIKTGAYQLEIRLSADYGWTEGNQLFFVTPPPLPPGRSFNSNDRLEKAISLAVHQNSAGRIPDGTTFTLSDGVNQLTFEFDVTSGANDIASGVTPGHVAVPIRAQDTAQEVAAKIRDAINSPTVQGLMKISASLRSTRPFNSLLLIDLHGPAAVTRTGLLTFSGLPAQTLSMVQSGVDTVFGEDLGDSNRKRDQGQLIVSATTISNSSGYGLVVDAAARSQIGLATRVGERPYPGAPRNLVQLNTSNLAPGAVIVNNILAFNAAGGMRISGDRLGGSDVQVPNSIARVINNTIYGNRSGDTGILVDQGASPTLLNNIIANTATGVNVAALSSTTVLGANLFKDNNANTIGTTTGSFPITLPSNAPLFVDPTNGRFYLAAGSQAIDSSLEALQERNALTQVKNAMGLPLSPMLAPDRDVTGQLRVDDPTVNTPAGQGANVFKDRGAVDRADFIGPEAVLLRPLDNDSANVDIDRTTTYVRLTNGNLDYFSVLLLENEGTGPDPRTVTADSLMLTENGRLLQPGVDYIFGYNANSRTIRLTPLAGIWRRDSTYELTLINNDTIRLSTVGGNQIQDGNQIVANLPGGASATFEFESGYVLQVPETLTLQVPATGAGLNGILDGQRFTITNGGLTATFEFDTNNNFIPGNRPIVIPQIATATEVRDAILAALQAPANADLELAPKAVGGDRIHLGSLAQHAASTFGSLLSLSGVAAGVADGQSFTYRPAGQSVRTFEFNLPGSSLLNASATPINILRTDTHLEIADKVAAALQPVVNGGFAPVRHIGGGTVHVGGAAGDVLSVGISPVTTVMTLTGRPGVTDSLSLIIPASGGSAIADGERFSITIGGSTATFEYTKDLSIGAGNRGITISDSDSAAVIATRTAAAIGSAGLGLSPSVNGGTIRLNEPRTTVVNLLNSRLSLDGVAGGAVPVPFIPSSQFTRYDVAMQLAAAMRNAGVGLSTVLAGDGGVLVTGALQINGAATTRIGAITDIAGNRLLPNRATSLTQFTIVMPEVPVDYGDAPNSYGTLQASNGARHALLPIDIPTLALGKFADGDADGSPNRAAQGDDIDSLIVLTSLPMTVGQAGPTPLIMPAPSTVGLVGSTITVNDAILKSVTLEFTSGGAPVMAGALAVDLAGAVTAADVATRFEAALTTALLQGRITGVLPVALGSMLVLGDGDQHQVDLSGAPAVQRALRGRVELTVQDATNYADGQLFTIQDGSGNSLTFQLSNSAGPGALVLGALPISVNLTTASSEDIATAIASAVNAAIAAGNLILPAVTVDGTTLTFHSDDEDGVQFGALFNANSNAVPITVTATASGMLDAWIDWNADGDFHDAGEQIIVSFPVRPGQNTFYIQTPASTLAINNGEFNTYARFRLSTTGGLLTGGAAIGGEVEDYHIEIVSGHPPVAVRDEYEVDEDEVLTVSDPALGVLGNDTDLDGSPIFVHDEDPFTPGIQPVRTTQFGTLVLNLDGTFVYTPDLDFYGTDTFVYRAIDTRLVSNAPTTVTITVHPVNDAPVAYDDEVTILEDQVSVFPGSTFWANDWKHIRNNPNEDGQQLRLIDAQIISPLGGSVSVVNDTLTYTPPLHYNSKIAGPALLLLTIEDFGVAGGDAMPLTSTSTLTVHITPVNDRPEFTMPSTTATVEDAGLVVVDSFITNIKPGPDAATDEATGPALETENQTVEFLVRALIPGLFAVQPTITPDGVLRYQLQPDVNRIVANGGTPGFPEILVEVIARDSGSAVAPNLNVSVPVTFTILPEPHNDAPEFTIPATHTSLEDVGLVTVAGFMTGIRPGPATALDEANQTLTVALSYDAAAFAIPPAIDLATGTLTYQTALHVNSYTGQSLQVIVTLTDSGPTGGPHVNASVQTFTLLVTPVNDPPEYTMPLTTGTEEDADLVTVPNFITGIKPGPDAANDEGPNREDQQVSFEVRPLRPELFAVLPLISPAGTLTYQLAPDVNSNTPAFPEILVEVIAQDSGASTAPDINRAAPRTFTILPTPINDAPEFTIPATYSTTEDIGLVTVPNFMTGIRPGPATALDELTQTLTVTVSADATAFTLMPSIDLATGTLTFQTGPDVNSLTGHNLVITVTLEDSGSNILPNRNSTTKSFTLLVTPVNDVPRFTLSTNSVTVYEDNEQVINQPVTQFVNFATGIAAGPATAVDETTLPATRQTLNFVTVSVSNPSLFSVQPTLSPAGMLEFVTATDRNGSAVVIVRLQDDGPGTAPDVNTSAEQTFTIVVRAVNDPPEFTIPATTNSREDQGLVTVPGFATNMRPGPTTAVDEIGQQFTVYVTALDPAAFAVQPSVAADGTLVYQVARDVNSNMPERDLRVTMYLTDNGTAGPLPDNNRSVTRTFTINVTPVNDAPLFTLPATTVEVIEDIEQFQGTLLTSIPGFATNVAAGPATATDEVNQLLTFEILSVSAPELFSVQPVISATGVLAFHTAAHKNGKAVVVTRLVDNGPSSPAPNVNASAPQTFTISITPVNDAPEFDIPAGLTVNEDQGLVTRSGFATNVRRGPVGAEDENSQEIQFFLQAFDPTAFEIQPSIQLDGTLTFRTARDVNSLNKDTRVMVWLVDNGPNAPAPNTNRSVTKTFSLTVNPVNDPPIAGPFSTTVTEDVPRTILAADVLVGAVGGPTSDELNQTVTMTQVERTTARGGSVVPTFVNGNIVSLLYTPPANLVGSDSFLYVLTDNGSPAASGTGTVMLTINGVNDPPQFTKGADQTVLEDAGVVTVANWATNILPGPPAATDELATQTVSFEVTTVHGDKFEVLPTVAPDGTLSFKTARDANGTAVVVVTAVDSGPGDAPNVNRSTPATLTINITPVNDPPVFTAGGSISVLEDSGAFSQPWATGVAPAAGLLSTPPTALDEQNQVVDFIVTPNRPGLFAVQPAISSTGVLTFTPAANAYGVALVTVVARDRGPSGQFDQNSSAPQTLTITINPVNDAPVAVGDNFTTNENTVLSVAGPGLLANDTDVDLPDDVLSVIPGTFTSTLGARVVLSADGSFVYDPTDVLVIQRLTTGQSLTDSFTYRIRDLAGAQSDLAIVTVVVSGIDDPPVANNDTYTIPIGQTILLDVLSNDTDVDTAIDPRTIQLTSLPAFGTATVNATGVISYTPGVGFRGTDTFTYTVKDLGGNVSNEARVNLIVNTPPRASNDAAFTVKNEPVTIDVLSNDLDPDGTLDLSSVQIVLLPSPSGTATVLSDGRVRFTPAAGFAGTVQFSYIVQDDSGSPSNVANVSVRVMNSRWENPLSKLDVSGDGFISPIDALLIINYLNSGAPSFLPGTGIAPPPYLDPSGDEFVTALDALLVINHLNSNASGEGELGTESATGGAGETYYSQGFVTMVTPEQVLATVGADVVGQIEEILHEALHGSLPAACPAWSTGPAAEGELDRDSGLWDDDEQAIDIDSLSLGRNRKSSSLDVDDYFGAL
jgi:VCBS repeat-containing protein